MVAFLWIVPSTMRNDGLFVTLEFSEGGKNYLFYEKEKVFIFVIL